MLVIIIIVSYKLYKSYQLMIKEKIGKVQLVYLSESVHKGFKETLNV